MEPDLQRTQLALRVVGHEPHKRLVIAEVDDPTRDSVEIGATGGLEPVVAAQNLVAVAKRAHR
jgi:hypothetical protein